MADDKNLDLTEGKVGIQIFRFIWPVLLSSLFQQFYSLTNQLIVGNYVSKTALSAVSACTTITMLFNYFFGGIGLGAGIVTSHAYGAKDKDKLKTAVETSLVISIYGGIILTLMSEACIGLMMKMININVGEVKKWHSDVPALQKILDEQPYSITYGTYCFIMSVACAVVTVMLKFIGSVFELIIKEDTPFTDKVIKRVVIVMIVLSAVMLFTMSAGFAALGGITTWVVYTIMDYGKTLQIQSDETL